MMTYNDTKARLNNEILTLRKSLSHENVDYVSEIEKYQLAKSNLEEELVNSHILTDSLRGEIDVLKQKLLESENEIVMIESHWQEQMNRVTQQFEQGMLLLKEKMKAKYAKQSTEAIQKQKQAFNQQHNNNNNSNSSSSSSNSSANSNIALTGMINGQGRLSAGRSSSSSAMTMTPSAISMASNGPEVISPASTPPSSPRKHRQVPNINAIALNVPKADVNAQVKQIISAAIHNNHNSGSGSSSSTPRNSISIKSSASSSLHSTPQPSIVNNAKRRESHTPIPTAVTTPVASSSSASSSLGSSYDPYNYSIEMKIDARRSSLEGSGSGSGRIPVGNSSNITATTTTINHSNNIYNNNYPSNPSSSANSTSTNPIIASGTNNKSDSPTPLTAIMRKTKINKEDEERGEDPVLDPRELNGFIRYFMNNNNSGGGGGSNSSQTNSVVTSQTTTAPQSHSSRQSIISPTSQDLNNWRAMASSSGSGYRGISGSGSGGASNDFFVKVARSELISPLRSVLRKELKNTFMMSTASSASSSSTPSSTPTALLNTITSNKLLYGSSAHFGSLDNNYPTSSRSSSSPSPRFMNNTSSRKSKIHEGKDAVMMPNNYLGKQRSGGVWRLSW